MADCVFVRYRCPSKLVLCFDKPLEKAGYVLDVVLALSDQQADAEDAWANVTRERFNSAVKSALTTGDAIDSQLKWRVYFATQVQNARPVTVGGQFLGQREATFCELLIGDCHFVDTLLACGLRAEMETDVYAGMYRLFIGPRQGLLGLPDYLRTVPFKCQSIRELTDEGPYVNVTVGGKFLKLLSGEAIDSASGETLYWIALDCRLAGPVRGLLGHRRPPKGMMDRLSEGLARLGMVEINVYD